MTDRDTRPLSAVLTRHAPDIQWMAERWQCSCGWTIPVDQAECDYEQEIASWVEHMTDVLSRAVGARP